MLERACHFTFICTSPPENVPTLKHFFSGCFPSLFPTNPHSLSYFTHYIERDAAQAAQNAGEAVWSDAGAERKDAGGGGEAAPPSSLEEWRKQWDIQGVPMRGMCQRHHAGGWFQKPKNKALFQDPSNIKEATADCEAVKVNSLLV